jgi:hypothetical protein
MKRPARGHETTYACPGEIGLLPERKLAQEREKLLFSTFFFEGLNFFRFMPFSMS